VLGSGLAARLRSQIGPLIPGLIVVAVMLVWVVDNGGYDPTTWYWGALVILAMLAAALLTRRRGIPLGRPTIVALGAFAAYVAWSYLSITWAGSRGDALDGSNRALLYLLIFSVMAMAPWTPRRGLVALTAFALFVGGVGIVLLARLSGGRHIAGLFVSGRLASPTGYINASAALFTLAALVAIVLASRSELPGEIRGALTAAACADLQLAVIVQSRGWLFTLPLVAIVGILVTRERLRVAAAAVLPIAGALIPLHRLLDVFKGAEGNYLTQAAGRAGTTALIVCVVVLIVATVIAWAERLLKPQPLTVGAKRRLGAVIVALAAVAFVVGGFGATHGHPFSFIKRQWNGFSHPTNHYSTQSHFADVGSGRYDVWRVALDAFVANPIGGLGQDNFDNYYVIHRRTTEEPAWTHSLELRLLAQTGLVGFLLFAAFIGAALLAASRAIRRRSGLGSAVAAVALLPLVVWLIHGSLDWFWEMPALSGPALGFLGIALALSREHAAVAPAPAQAAVPPAPDPARRPFGWRAVAAVVAAVAIGTVVFGFPYLSARQTAAAEATAATDPDAALSMLRKAADLDPLSATPGRSAGTIALNTAEYRSAQSWFVQVVSRDPGGWFGWFGEGLASSALGDRSLAHSELARALSINSKQPIIREALARVYSPHPVTPVQGLRGILNED
jgi:hypothetical protein